MTATIAPTWADRILDDGTDRSRWLIARRPVIGASDAKTLSKAASVDKYLAAKLRNGTWTGNEYTASGRRWEPMMLAWAGIPSNLALIHAPLELGFAATPDGITADGTRIAECKARHDRKATGPNLGEWRQIAWQLLCVPEADALLFVEAELVRGELYGEPVARKIRRDDPKVREVTERIVPIAFDLLARLRAALELEKELGL